MEENSVSDPDVLDYDSEESESDKIDNNSQEEAPIDTSSHVDNDKDREAAKSSSSHEQSETNQNDSSLAHPAGSKALVIIVNNPSKVTRVNFQGCPVYSRHDLLGAKSQTSSSTQAKISENCDVTKEPNGTTNCANNSINNIIMNVSANNGNIVTQVYRVESYYYTAGRNDFFYRDPVMPRLERIRPLEISTTQQQDSDDDYGVAPTLDYYGPSTEPNPDYYM